MIIVTYNVGHNINCFFNGWDLRFVPSNRLAHPGSRTQGCGVEKQRELLYSTYMELDERLRKKVAGYKPSAAAIDPIRHAPLLINVGISGSGKNALLHRLLQKYPKDYHFTISHTSRAPRTQNGAKEINGIDYHFVNLATMESMVDEQAFIEVAVIHDAWVSGSSISEVALAEREGKIAVNDIDIQGADHYVKLGLQVKPVFIMPPSFEVWIRRLSGRYGGMDNLHKSELALRMQSAIREIEHAIAVDHFYIVINDDLEKTVDLINDIAHDKPVEPHYHKAMDIAKHMLEQLHEELAKLV